MRTTPAEVLHISARGFSVRVGAQEHFLAFEEFPWFRDAPVPHVLNVELPQPHHLYWPDLDIDLTVESIEHPERFPLASGPHTS